MSLESFLDIRFGDPVISITLNTEGLAYGSMMGRLLYYNFASHQQRVINELSDEYISGLWLSKQNSLFVSIGDIKGTVISNLLAERFAKQQVAFDKIHTSISCQLSQIKMHKDVVFLAVLEPKSANDSLTHIISPINIIDLSTKGQKLIEGVRFGPYCVFFDFDGKKLLFMEYEGENRVVYFYRIGQGIREIRAFSRGFGKIGFFKIIGKKIVYVHKQKVIKVLGKTGNDHGEIGRHTHYIVALGFVKAKRDLWNSNNKQSIGEITEDKGESDHRRRKKGFNGFVISIDYYGCLRIWDERKMIEEIRIDELKDLTRKYQTFQYFSMGYPYYIAASGYRIAITTDIGVLLVKSKVLEECSLVSK